MHSKKGKLMFWAGLAVSLLFVGYAVAEMDLRKAFSVIATVDPKWFLPIAALHLLVFYFRALRWWYIVEPTKRVAVQSLFSALSIGFMGNMIFPMRIGEIIRAYVIARKEKIDVSSAVGTIVVERGFDMFGLLVILALVIVFANPVAIPADTWQDLRTGGIVLLTLLVGMFAVLFLMAGEGGTVNRLFLRLAGLAPDNIARKITELFDSFRSGLQALKKGHHVSAILFHNTMVWIGIFFFNYLFLPMFDLGWSLEMALVVSLFIVFGVAVPSSPGFIGPFHAGIVLALGFYGVDADSALGVAIVLHLTAFIYTVVMGLFFLWREKMSIGELKHSVE